MSMTQIMVLDTISADHPHHSSIWVEPHKVGDEIYDAITNEVVRAGANVPGPVFAEIRQL